ncbi:MAG: hypothetical protein KBC53_12160, partial [Nitrosomonas sp.]|nr:hypothetical protein [Nitrosomonas sp.]
YTSLMYYLIPSVNIDNRLVNLTISGLPDQQNDLRSVLESMSGLSLSRGISNDVSDWSNYESQSLGISFSYPAEYVVDVFSQDRSANRDSIKLYDQSTYRAKQNGQNVALAANIGFWIIDNPEKLSALDWAKQNTDHSNFKGKYKTLQIDSREAISYAWYGLGGGDRVLLVSDDRKSIYSFEVYFMDINEQIRNDFVDIVQTIKFLK